MYNGGKASATQAQADSTYLVAAAEGNNVVMNNTGALPLTKHELVAVDNDNCNVGGGIGGNGNGNEKKDVAVLSFLSSNSHTSGSTESRNITTTQNSICSTANGNNSLVEKKCYNSAIAIAPQSAKNTSAAKAKTAASGGNALKLGLQNKFGFKALNCGGNLASAEGESSKLNQKQLCKSQIQYQERDSACDAGLSCDQLGIGLSIDKGSGQGPTQQPPCRYSALELPSPSLIFDVTEPLSGPPINEDSPTSNYNVSEENLAGCEVVDKISFDLQDTTDDEILKQDPAIVRSPKKKSSLPVSEINSRASKLKAPSCGISLPLSRLQQPSISHTVALTGQSKEHEVAVEGMVLSARQADRPFTGRNQAPPLPARNIKQQGSKAANESVRAFYLN